MLALAVPEEEIIAAIETLGWRKTSDTGVNSTNCQLNDLGIAVHFKKLRYNPYVMEIAEQVRGGQPQLPCAVILLLHGIILIAPGAELARHAHAQGVGGAV